jgi:hypothetical protein
MKYDPSGTAVFFGNSVPGALNTFAAVPDPQCVDASQVSQVDSHGVTIGPSNSLGCNLKALAVRVPVGTPGSFLIDPTNPAEVAGHYVLLNAKPGQYGVLTPNVLTSFGNFSLDANASKSVHLNERNLLTIRIDATNVLNHPVPFIPYFAPLGQGLGGSGQFGEILCGCNETKSGTRTFQGQLRLTF